MGMQEEEGDEEESCEGITSLPHAVVDNVAGLPFQDCKEEEFKHRDQGERAEEEEAEPRRLMLYSDKLSVYLVAMDPVSPAPSPDDEAVGGRLPYELNVVASAPLVLQPPIVFDSMLHRVLFLEYVPELSAVIVGSSGADSVALLRVVLDTSTGKYSLLREAYLPDTQTRIPICGLTVASHNGGREEEIENDLQSWRVYILYLDGTLTCCELRRDPRFNPLAISRVLL